MLENRDRKSIILGGAGFIGSNLARALVASGEKPKIFTRPTYSISYLKDILNKVDLIYGDFMDDVVLKEAIQGVDTVYHLISTTFPSMTISSTVYDVLSNLLPTIRLLEICKANGVKKIVYASSGGTIYGDPIEIPITEKHPTTPISSYGQSKLTIENYLCFYSRNTDIDIEIIRISNPYGPAQNPFGVQGLIAVALGCIIGNRILKIYGKGDAIRDYIFIDDVIEAIIFASQSTGSNILNISTSKGYSVIEVVEMIEEVTGHNIRKEFIPERPGDVKVNILSNALAKQKYNWHPKITLNEGLTRTWNWIRINK